jgi:hypothetical protein
MRRHTQNILFQQDMNRTLNLSNDAQLFAELSRESSRLDVREALGRERVLTISLHMTNHQAFTRGLGELDTNCEPWPHHHHARPLFVYNAFEIRNDIVFLANRQEGRATADSRP